MINQALNIANLYRQAKFELLDENDKIQSLQEEAKMFEKFNEEINKEGNTNGQ